MKKLLILLTFTLFSVVSYSQTTTYHGHVLFGVDNQWPTDSSRYITKSQARSDIHDSIAGIITVETDPVWLADSSRYISKSQARSDIHDSIANIVIPSSNPADSVAYSTAFPFNKAFTLMKHTLTDNDIITVNVANKTLGAGGQILFKNNATNTPILSAFHVSGVYDNTLNYSLCTFIYLGVVSGSDIYVCSIINFN